MTAPDSPLPTCPSDASAAHGAAAAAGTSANAVAGPSAGVRRSIQPLAPLLVNQIAAGEVIERPASVVKELVENAIDAGATRIRISLEQGGRELIEITDDGSGIPADELPLAIAPHATSKIREQHDLDGIATLGFRGEALASIMSVSRLTIVSRPRGAEAAACLRAEADVAGAVEPCGGPPGTTISVRNLFFATPARRKFLRTPQTEYNHISELVQRLAMSHPAIGFTLVHEGKTRLDLRPGQRPRDRVLDILGRELEPEFVEVSADDGGTAACLTLWGLLGTPSIARSHAKAQHVFLNGRFIRDKTVMHAVKEAYRGLLDPSKYPAVVVYIEMDPAFVDVNVHPTKAEVRFRDQQHVHGFLLNTMRNRLREADLTPSVSLRNGGFGGYGGAGGFGGPMAAAAEHHENGGVAGGSAADRRFADFFGRAAATQYHIMQHSREGDGGGSGGGFGGGFGGRGDFAPGPLSDGFAGFDYQTVRRELEGSGEGFAPADLDGPAADRELHASVDGIGDNVGNGTMPAFNGHVHAPLSNMSSAEQARIVAAAARALQVHGSYLIIEEDDGISIVDQHALHERVMFEQLRHRILSQGRLESQRLLMPAVVDLNTAERMEQFERLVPMLDRLGIEADPMGPRQIGVHAFPSFLFERNVDPIDFMIDLIDLAENNGLNGSNEDDREAALHEVLDMMSCKAAVKAGDHLTPDEINALLSRRHEIERAGRCPHGRPTTIRLSLRDLEKQFGRR